MKSVKVKSIVVDAFRGLAEEERTVVAELGESLYGSSGGDVAQRDGRAACAGESGPPPAEQQLQIHMRWK